MGEKGRFATHVLARRIRALRRRTARWFMPPVRTAEPGAPPESAARARPPADAARPRQDRP